MKNVDHNREKRELLEELIFAMIVAFEIVTGVTVKSIDVVRSRRSDDGRRPVGAIKVKVESDITTEGNCGDGIADAG